MEWLLIFVAGFLAAGVDGALGMGFGPTSAALLLGAGLSPACTSAAVNVAKTGAGIAGSIAHWRFSNIDRRLVVTLAAPGVVGAVIGVVVLANVDANWLRPALAGLLCLVGVRILLRFAGRQAPPSASGPKTASEAAAGAAGSIRERIDWGAAGVGAVGGCTNGLIGAWGPVVTPYLVHRGVPVRFAIGSVNTAEVAVAVVSVGALFVSGTGGVAVGVVLPMLAGGVLAAPIAAHLVRRVPQRAAGIAVATMLLLSQLRELAAAFEIGPERWIAYAAVGAAVLVSARPMRRAVRAVDGPSLEVAPSAGVGG